MNVFKNFKALTLSIAFTLAPNFAFADGPGNGGGGDNCEERIKEIRGDIQKWIARGGHKIDLDLPEGITPQIYENKMNAAMSKAKINCPITDERNRIVVCGSEKVCKFEKVKNVFSITCDYKKFMDKQTMDSAQQYRLIHHEFAGLADIEKPKCEDSVYEVSDQITDYLENQIVHKLAVKPKASATVQMTEPLAVASFLHPNLIKIFTANEKQFFAKEKNEWAVNTALCASIVNFKGKEQLMIWTMQNAVVFEGDRAGNDTLKKGYMTTGCELVEFGNRLYTPAASNNSFAPESVRFRMKVVPVPANALFLQITGKSVNERNDTSVKYNDVVVGLISSGAEPGKWYLSELCSGFTQKKCEYVPNELGPEIKIK